jgi:Tol biopolymer transport system component/C-terminal processing protease CtpA/Prc
MRRQLMLSILWAPALVLSSAAFSQALPTLSDPAISPDGREIVFVSGGDIWSVPASGGDAHLLVTHPATESRPMYSPDGKKLAFVSTRTGAGNIYILTLATGELMRLTYSDVADRLDGWSPDGEWIYFTSAVNDIAGQGDIFRVKSSGGTPLEVSRERYLNEFESAPSPDGKQIALMARGISSTQWWRNGHAHIDETEVWLKPIAETGAYRKLLAADAKHAWPMWSADGQTLYCMSDASGAENIWAVPVASPAAAKEVTHFKEGRVLWPTIGAGGKTIVFERGFAVWRLDLGSGKAERVPIQLRGSSAATTVTHSTETSFRGLALSPDGKKLAVVAHGQLFAASAKDGGEGVKVRTLADTVNLTEPVWSPDSTSVVYKAERKDGARVLEVFDFKPGDELGKARALTSAPGEVFSAEWSPDGKMIAYVQDEKELHLITLGAKPEEKPTDKVLTKGELPGPAIAWSPDSQWIAFTEVDGVGFRNLHVVAAAGGEVHPISFLANGESANEKIAWSPDGKYILFDTSQRSETPKMARIDLLPHVPKFKEDEFRELFRPAKAPGAPDTPRTAPNSTTPDAPGEKTDKQEAAAQEASTDKPKPAAKEKDKKPEPVKIVFEGIRERLTILPIGLGAESPVISPDGKTLLFTAAAANQQNLYTYSLDELAKEPAIARQLTSTPGRKAAYAFTPDSKEVFYLENDGVRTITLEAKMPKPVAVSARVQVDFEQEKRVVFEEAWNELNRNFFDPSFHGQNWRKLHDEWLPYAEGAQTPDELRADINLMIGELNASHSGIGVPRGGADRGVQVGKLGLRFDREQYEAGQGLVVSEVISLSPAAIEGTIKPGDKLVAVNGEAIGARDLDALLEDTVGQRVALTVETGGKTRQAVVRPVATGAATGQLYRQWVESRRALVERVSGGKLGYVHLPDMGDGSLQQLYLDLDAQNESKQGVVIDIRNNNGGYINGYALDVFTRRNYLEMTPRDLTTIPSRQALGQRALGKPTVLVTNESSLSDAEDFTEGYRTLGVGKVVGEPTAGWIIFTGGTALIDGSTLRLPSTRIRDTRGEDMEMHPRPVDVEASRSLGETGDAQLERAVKVLLAASN